MAENPIRKITDEERLRQIEILNDENDELEKNYLDLKAATKDAKELFDEGVRQQRQVIREKKDAPLFVQDEEDD